VSDVTRILGRVEQGDAKAAAELLPLVYDELRKLATHHMANEAPGHTLQPTALVHEAWLRLTQNEQTPWNSRGHFFAAAAEAMRRILIENARRKQRTQCQQSRKVFVPNSASIGLTRAAERFVSQRPCPNLPFRLLIPDRSLNPVIAR